MELNRPGKTGIFLTIDPEYNILNYMVNNNPDEGFMAFVRQNIELINRIKQESGDDAKDGDYLMLRYDFENEYKIPPIQIGPKKCLCNFLSYTNGLNIGLKLVVPHSAAEYYILNHHEFD